MAQLKADVIVINADLQFHFLRMKTGWYWGIFSEESPRPETYYGPHLDYKAARIDAWRKKIEGTVHHNFSFVQEVGYAWDRQIANRPPLE